MSSKKGYVMPRRNGEFLVASKIAEAVARREMRLAKLTELTAPRAILDYERLLLASALRALRKNQLAKILLAQARVIVAQRDARASAIAKTKLGKMVDILEDVIQYQANPLRTSLRGPSFSVRDEEGKDRWQELFQILDERRQDKEKIIEVLHALLVCASAELLHVDLPDVEWTYKEIR